MKKKLFTLATNKAKILGKEMQRGNSINTQLCFTLHTELCTIS